MKTIKILTTLLIFILVSSFTLDNKEDRSYSSIQFGSEYENGGYEYITIFMGGREYQVLPAGDKVRLYCVTTGFEFIYHNGKLHK